MPAEEAFSLLCFAAVPAGPALNAVTAEVSAILSHPFLILDACAVLSACLVALENTQLSTWKLES